MRKYRSLNGYEVRQTPGTKILQYPIDIENIFIDDVFHADFFKCPIIINTYPDYVYDKLTLFEWFSRSNINPFNGIKMDNKVQYTHILSLFAAGLLLEKKDNKLLFHVPEMNLENFMTLAQEILYSNKYTMIDMNKWII